MSKTIKRTVTTIVEEEVVPTNEGLYTEVLVDMSGSMSNVWDSTIAGINELKNGPSGSNDTMSLTFFDNVVERPYINKSVKSIPDVTRELYHPRGSTALLDAIGTTIRSVENMKDRPSKVLFVIITDGQENASREFNNSQVSALIREKEAQGWEFLYMGANQDAWSTATNIGIQGVGKFNFASNPTVTAAAFKGASATRSAYSSGMSYNASVGATYSTLNAVAPELNANYLDNSGNTSIIDTDITKI